MIALGASLVPLVFAGFYFGGAISWDINDFLVNFGMVVVAMTIFDFNSPIYDIPLVWLLLWIGIQFTWGLGYLYLGRWGFWLLFALAGLVINSGGLMFAARVAEQAPDTLYSPVRLPTTSSRVVILAMGLIAAAVVFFTCLDALRRLRARSA